MISLAPAFCAASMRERRGKPSPMHPRSRRLHLDNSIDSAYDLRHSPWEPRVMDRFENNPAYWRARAEETRAIAANVQEPAARKHVESMAASYERIAEMAEHVALVPAPHALKAANQP